MAFLSRRLVIHDVPSRSVIRALLIKRWWLCLPVAVLLSVSAFLLIEQLHTPHSPPQVTAGALDIAGTPAGAMVAIDGRPSGRVPGRLTAPAGRHQVTVTAPGYLSETQAIDMPPAGAVPITAELWLAQPRTAQLLPPLPGATLAGANFLADGRVALQVAMPLGDERQLWIDGPGSEQHRVGPALARGSAAVSSDGNRVAYLASPAGSLASGQPPTELWLAGADGQAAVQRYVLPAQSGGNGQLTDITWTPDGQHLLLVARLPAPAGGQRNSIDWLAADVGQPHELLNLPSDVVPGSYDWSPDGNWVTFLATGTGRTSLCLLGVPDGDFRYLGDISSAGLAHPLPFAPASWRAGGNELLYSAATSRQADVGGWLFAAGSSSGLYTVRPSVPAPTLVPGGQGQTPIWMPDGSLLTLARGKAAGPLLVRHQTGSAPPVDGPPLAITSGPAFGARWDLARAQALVVVHGDGLDLAGDANQYWLAQFRPGASS